jgi:hypothetical protein
MHRPDRAGILFSDTMLTGLESISNYTKASFYILKADKEEDIFFINSRYTFEQVKKAGTTDPVEMTWSENTFLVLGESDIFLVKTSVPAFDIAPHDDIIWIQTWLSRVRFPKR